jgi:UDPglucose--hexose-1-phosphate uridylyltransferase
MDNNKNSSELRLDLVSGDWVVIAANRAHRPKDLTDIDCPFCGHDKIVSIPNDFPAFSYADNLNERFVGPNGIMDGVGFHEVVIYPDHNKDLNQFSIEEFKEMTDVFQARYTDLINNKFIRYVSIFHNHGKEAGASVKHPHSQIIAIPVIDPQLRGSIEGAENFYARNNKCVYCVMIEWDKKDGKRIIYENEKFVVLCPFAPQSNFEVRIYPREHLPHFEIMNQEEKMFFADALQEALHKIYNGLNDPAYNFYIHTAPKEDHGHEHYHWHLTILPRLLTPPAGFEFCAGMEINTVSPETAAELLRNAK